MSPVQAATDLDHRERILRVLVHLQDHLDEALDVEALAKVAHLSPFHFHRVFRALVGETAMEHVRRLRLERAARRLKLTDDPVVEIAFSAGYEAHESFTRAFASRFSIPPAEYRRQGRAEGAESSARGGAPKLPELATPALQVEIRSLDVTRAAFARHIGPYDQVGEAWQRLMAFAGPRGLAGHPAFALVYDDPEVTDPARFRYDACLEIGPQMAAEGAIGVQTVSAGRFAVAVHRGAYEGLSATYGHLLAVWAPRNGFAIAEGPSIERYHDDPARTSASERRTEVWLRVQTTRE